jgi:hypothetical protein
VTQAILVEGRHRVRVHDPAGGPPPGFEKVTPTLEDAYLVLMRGASPRAAGATNGATNGARLEDHALLGERP